MGGNVIRADNHKLLGRPAFRKLEQAHPGGHLIKERFQAMDDMGRKGILLPDTPERVGVPSFLQDYWTPFLEMYEATGMPLNFHLNSAVDPNRMTWEGFGFEQTLSVVAIRFSIGHAATLGNWVVSGQLDRHPKLKIGLIESGMG